MKFLGHRPGPVEPPNAQLESSKRETRCEPVKFFNPPLVRGPWSEAEPR